MLCLADFEHKQVYEGDVLIGDNAAVMYDNITRKCVLKLNDKLFLCKTKDKNTLSASSFEISDERAACTGESSFGEIFAKQRVYDTNGKFLGELENAEFTSKLLLRKITVNNSEFTRGQIASIGDAVIIRAKSPKQLLRQREKELNEANATVAPQTESPQPTQISSAQLAVTEQHSQTPIGELSTQTPAQHGNSGGRIRRRYGNFNFLLGKIADKTIVNFQGEVMIKKKETVTKEVLRQAKISGKLIELYLHVE